jgi:4-amino-4-deoxy-L-arabinose transferase-like glycosyltransferase
MPKSFYYRIITPAWEFASQWHIILAGAMLAVMFGLSFGAMVGDSAIVDEVAHIPAGYSYLHYGDYRLNPEHPPLMKDLAALPLQFMNLKFPNENAAWTTDVNGQWETGWTFLYHIGNNADAILFWARLPILLLAIAFGMVLYRFCWQRWGKAVALLSLFFYALSPNIIAHSHYVTTDLGASVFMFLALVTFVRYCEKSTRANLILLTLALALAQLAKFSAVLLFPFMGIASLVLVALEVRKSERMSRLVTLTGGLILASFLSVLVVWAVYIPHTINMPQDVQDRLIRGTLYDPAAKPIIAFLTTINHVPIFKPLAQYILGISMVFSRVAGGNITYFNGQISNQSFHLYFPELFLFKTQIAFLILGLICLIGGFVTLRRHRGRALVDTLLNSCRRHQMEWTLGAFAAFYFAVSIVGNLDLGIRHILPIYVPLFVIVAVGTVAIARKLNRSTRCKLPVAITLAILLPWYGLSTVFAYPSFTSYFNEFTGGGAGAGRYFSDSSVDWGQDLLRLKSYVTAHPEIKHIAVDYFGGAIPQYYFCDRTYDANGNLIPNGSGYDCSKSVYEEWHSSYGTYTGQYIAVSETYLQNDRYFSAKAGTTGYANLRAMTPIAKIGNSIYVYKLY